MNASKALPFATPMLLATILMEDMTVVVMMDLKAMDTIVLVRSVHLSDEIMTRYYYLRGKKAHYGKI